MVYITARRATNHHLQRAAAEQIELPPIPTEDWLNALYNAQPLEEPAEPENPIQLSNRSKGFYQTFTLQKESSSPSNSLNNKLFDITRELWFAIKLLEDSGVTIDNINDYYESFDIPKRSGGYRTIDAPKPELMNFLRTFKDILNKYVKVQYHNNAYAYFPGRNAKDAAILHQDNASHWFLKMDVTDFFGSCTPELVMEKLQQVHPFNILLNYSTPIFTNNNEAVALSNCLKIALGYCFKDGKLPQGTPMSPMLTNLIMIPFDYAFNKICHQQRYPVVYTRYADDIMLSTRQKWEDFHVWEDLVETTFEHMGYPFKLKKAKTHYGSRAGKNWMLGVMLNKDNQLTIGHRNKERMHAAINNFIRDFTNNIKWSKLDVQKLQGNLAYLANVEPEYAKNLVQKYELKYNLPSYSEAAASILRAD